MPGRILVVTSDDHEWQALTRELGARFELHRANGRDQALAALDRDSDFVALVAYWGALSSGPELMRHASTRKAQVARVLIFERPNDDAARALVAEGVVRAVVGSPAAVAEALEPAAAPPQQHPLRTEARTPARVQLGVSTPAWEGFLQLYTKDVSRGGVFFLFARLVMPTSGSRCKVAIGSETVEGTVAHVLSARLATATGTDAGFGVSFPAPLAAEWWVPLLAKPAPPATAAAPARQGAPTAKELEAAKNFHALGMSFYDDRNYAAARQKFELAGRVAPHPRHEAMQAVCHGAQLERNGDSTQAREAFSRALRIDPDCAPAKTALARMKK